MFAVVVPYAWSSPFVLCIAVACVAVAAIVLAKWQEWQRLVAFGAIASLVAIVAVQFVERRYTREYVPADVEAVPVRHLPEGWIETNPGDGWPAPPTETHVAAPYAPVIRYTECPIGCECQPRKSVAVVDNGGTKGTAFCIGENTWVTASHVAEQDDVCTVTIGCKSTTGKVIQSQRDGCSIIRTESDLGASHLKVSPAISKGQRVRLCAFDMQKGSQRLATWNASVVDATSDGWWELKGDRSAMSGNMGGPVVDECGSVVGMIFCTNREDVTYTIPHAKFAELCQ